MKGFRFFVVYLALLCCNAHAFAAPHGADLLRAMMVAGRTVSYTATETIVSPGAPTVISTVCRSGPKQCIEYSSPPIMKGDVLVDDGTNVWRYHRAENSAVKTKTAQRGRAADRNTWHLRFEAKTLSSTKIGTRKVWIVAVSLKGNSRVLRKFWIDDASKIRLRSEQFNERGERIETHALSNLKIGAVPETVFEFTPPRGAHISSAGTLYTRLSQAQHHAAWLRAPASLPRGYAFESAILDEVKNESWLRYTNGVRRFSIFQQRTAENKNSPLTRVGAGWYWQKDGNRFLVAGLPQTQAGQIASSIR